MKYQVYAIDKGGEGHVQSLGVFNDITELVIRIGMFAPDVIITLEEFVEEEVSEE